MKEASQRINHYVNQLDKAMEKENQQNSMHWSTDEEGDDEVLPGPKITIPDLPTIQADRASRLKKSCSTMDVLKNKNQIVPEGLLNNPAICTPSGALEHASTASPLE